MGMNASDTEYYVLSATVDHQAREESMLLENLQWQSKSGSWQTGVKFEDAPPNPIVLDIVSGYEEDTTLLSYDDSVPMMRDDLIEALHELGVDNIDAYPVAIRNTVSGEQIRGYSAINVIGLVSAADPAKTEFSPDEPSHMIDADIDSLTIDRSGARGLLLFRLAECCTAVIVHRHIKEGLEARSSQLPDIRFIHPKDFVG